MANVTRLSKNNIPRWHLLLIFTILFIFTKCNGISSKLHSTKLSDTFLLKESVVIPSNNAEEEAKRLYNEALKQYGDLGKTLKEICDPWKAKGCTCTGTSEEVSLICRHTRFTTVPQNLPEEIIKLDLGSNNITVLKNHSFTMLPMLEELILSDNKLHTIESDAFLGLKNLKRLVLQGCGFTSLPTEALESIKSLTSLNLANNRLTLLDDEDFPVIKTLQYLFLKRNQIREISSGVFRNLSKLKVLDLDDNKLESLSSGLKNLTQLQELTLSNNKIMTISHGSLPLSLLTLEMRANPLKNIHESAIRNLKKLKKLVLSDARNLNELPSFEGCISLEILRVDHSDLTHIPDSLCTHSPRLKTLELKFNKLRHVPNLRQCHELRLLNLASNKISSIHNKPFENLGQLHDLLIPYNQIETIPYDAFNGMKKLQTLNLEGNNINFVHEKAFSGFTQLEDLNLGNNIFSSLPTSGLERLLHLKTFNNPRLRIFPAIEKFPRIRTLILSYAYHCCAFLPLLTSNSKVIESPYKEEVFFPTDEKFDMSMWNNSINDIWPDLNGNVTNAFQSQMNDILQSYSNPYADFGYPSITNFPDENELYSGEESRILSVYESSPTLVKCLPTPGPFLPCEDLFDWWTLRCGVWVVFLLALLGNGIVVFVLIFSRSKMDVPRFLVCNLAAADFFMGVYLGFLAVVDASTLGEFRMFAIRWQMSVGCQLSGFLAVLSSELSVYTLAVITLERNYAITHAMHLNKRLSLRHASYIMSVGWLFALTMAVLPLFGVSDYRKYSVCLPMEVYKGYGSLTYVIFLMFINGVAFLTLMGCYLKMYCAIRGSQAWNSNDSRIAKRMALLVFTDFLCWSPIAFFSIAAVLGWQLITLEQAKVFTVFILPLNSCCNPFLYAILTKQFKKDCVMLCKAIEESRVTRGIGRCRHSSNFSNRQTPGNTNSLNERSSRDGALPPLLPAHACTCNRGKVIDHEEVKRQLKKAQPSLFARFWKRLFCSDSKNLNIRRNHRHMDYSYHIAEVQQKNHKRAGSMSSSDGNFSSSRSDSWKHGSTPHHCGVPLRLLDPRRRHTSWLITRKTSQDSNLSSSRNDSSGSNNTTATTASGSTWRISRSSGSNIVIPGLNIPTFSTCNSSRQSISGNKPRLVRQSAFHDESQEPTSPRLNVRFLPTIPSAPDSSVQLEDDENPENDPENQEDCVHLQIINNIENDTENSTNSSSPKIQSKPP